MKQCWSAPLLDSDEWYMSSQLSYYVRLEVFIVKNENMDPTLSFFYSDRRWTASYPSIILDA